MRTKTLPLPAVPQLFRLRTQPLRYFRFSLRLLVRLPVLAPSRTTLRPLPPALPPRRLRKLRRSLLQRSRLLRLRLRLLRRHRQALRRFPRLRPLPRLRRSDSPPDKFCPPSSRLCPESPSTARGSCPRVSRRW